MTETAKERIENEIKSVEKRLHGGRNDGKTYNTGVKEGLMIARAHVIDFSTNDEKTVEKLQERCDRYEQVLTEISKTKDFYRSGCDHWEEFSQDALKAQHVLKEFV
ncbi:hypothetical protein K231HA_01773 [Lactococcus lactis]|uniref:hypothetical protein n=1 Tax=Lactococcus lactis TaxID=1358 RepID=UPI0007263B1E|nr:hypothetical protein [Lactococcus lactis]KST79562.1 prophage pi3 protein 34 [Lactococcus lactis subsp. lactis]MDU0411720.1 hypothetical protein [Lactococcus lactis]